MTKKRKNLNLKKRKSRFVDDCKDDCNVSGADLSCRSQKKK